MVPPVYPTARRHRSETGKSLAIFLKKMKINGIFFLMSSFWQFFDSQMAIFRRVMYTLTCLKQVSVYV